MAETEIIYEKVEKAFREMGIKFTRTGLEFRIPNFGEFYRTAVTIADNALSDTSFYAQEIPYREMCGRECGSLRPEKLLILNRDENK